MHSDNCFPRTIVVPGLMDGDPPVELALVWHHCSDYSLMAALGGYCSCSSKNPCLFCTWTRGDNAQPAPPRELGNVHELARWAEAYVQPVHTVAAKVSMSRLGPFAIVVNCIRRSACTCCK
jgi:hypothetical protein